MRKLHNATAYQEAACLGGTRLQSMPQVLSQMGQLRTGTGVCCYLPYAEDPGRRAHRPNPYTSVLI